MKVKHPEKYNGKLTAAMRAAILAGAVAVTGGCSLDKNPVMGDVPAPEPISTNDSPEEFITIGEIPSEIIEGMLPAEPEPVEEETPPQDVVFSEEMLTPRMVAIPAYNEVPLPIHLEKVANEAVVEQPKGEDEKEIIIKSTRGVLPIEPVEEETPPQDVVFSEEMLTPRMVAIPAYLPAHLEKVANEAVVEQPKAEDKEDIYIVRTAGKPAPNMDNPPEPPTPEEDSAAEDAKAREELDKLIQEIAKEKAEADKAKAKE